MKPLFHPYLVNGVTGDPALYIDFSFQNRAVLFDLGDIHALPAKKILRIEHVFISHAHMDHFIGFDQLLRLCIGRQKRLCMYGPPAIIEQIQSRLGGYSWNLVHNYESNFTIEVNEYGIDQTIKRALFDCQSEFKRHDLEEIKCSAENVLLEDNEFEVSAAHLDHMIPSLAFALQEKRHVNVWKDRLDELGLPTGPWLNELKSAVLNGDNPEKPFRVWWRDSDQINEKIFPLGELIDKIIRIVPGQKLAYATDFVFSESNKNRLVSLADGANTLFIEATFSHEDIEHAARTYHLTAIQAGIIAKLARAKNLMTFHYSPRYGDDWPQLEQQAQAAFLEKTENH